jgi:hypothetical protein
VLHFYLLLRGESQKFTSLKFLRQCPLVLLAKVGGKEGKALESEIKAIESGLLGRCRAKKKLSIRAD